MSPLIGHPIQQHVTFLGPFGVGKSTAVHQLSDTPVVRTEVTSSAAVRGGRQSAKRTTTVGLDYGEWLRRNGTRIALIGTPGQQRFRAVQQLVAARSTAYVLLLYGNHRHAVGEALEWVEYFGGQAIAPRLVFGVTRLDGSGPELHEYERALAEIGLHVPVLACDPRDATDVARVVMVGVERGEAASTRTRARQRSERHGEARRQHVRALASSGTREGAGE